MLKANNNVIIAPQKVLRTLDGLVLKSNRSTHINFRIRIHQIGDAEWTYIAVF